MNQIEAHRQPASGVRHRRRNAAVVLSTLAIGSLFALVGGGQSAIAAGPRSCTPNERYVFATYQDFLGRDPDDSGLLYWAGNLLGGMPRSTYTLTLARSDEWIARIIDDFYLDVIGRPGDPNGRAFWIGELRRGVPVAAVAALFYSSDEYFAAHGNNVRDWLIELYAVLLLRPADEAGLNYWTSQTATSGRTAVAGAFYQSLEKRLLRVDDLYQALLGRGSDDAGRQYWAGIILSQGDIALASFLASSDEYFNAAQAVDPGCPSTPPTTPTTAAPVCHSSYPDFCLPPPPPDLNCPDINATRFPGAHADFTVVGSDPHGFDADHDGRGCEQGIG